MDLSKLNANERMAFWGAVASIVGGLIATFGYGGGGGLILTLVLGIAMIAILFLPQWSPQTSLPGSKGTLMLLVGGVAALGSVLGLLALLAFLGLIAVYAGFFLLPLIGLVLGIIGGFMMGWAGWKEFQAEGGKFQLGSSGGGSAGTTAPPATPPTATPPTAGPPAGEPMSPSEPMAAPSQPEPPREPMAPPPEPMAPSGMEQPPRPTEPTEDDRA